MEFTSRGQWYHVHKQKPYTILFKCPDLFYLPIGCNRCTPQVPFFLMCDEPWLSSIQTYFSVSFEPSTWDPTKGELALLLRATQRNEFYCVWNRLAPWKDCQWWFAVWTHPTVRWGPVHYLPLPCSHPQRTSFCTPSAHEELTVHPLNPANRLSVTRFTTSRAWAAPGLGTRFTNINSVDAHANSMK